MRLFIAATTAFIFTTFGEEISASEKKCYEQPEFFDAFQAVRNDSYQSLVNATSNTPDLFACRDATGSSLLDHAILFTDYDLVWETRSGLAHYLLKAPSLRDQLDYDRTIEKWRWAIGALDKHQSRIDLAEEMTSGVFRGDLISLFPAIETLRSEGDTVTHQEAVLNLLKICNAAAYQDGDVDGATIEVMRKQFSVLGRTELVLLDAYVQAGIVSENCIVGFLTKTELRGE